MPKTSLQSRRNKIMEITGKRAQKIHLQELTECVNDLKRDALCIEDNFSLIRRGKRNNKYSKVPLREEIRTAIIETETDLAKLKTLDKDNESIEYYESKIEEWKAQLQKVEQKVNVGSTLNRTVNWFNNIGKEEEEEEKAAIEKIHAIELDDNDPKKLIKVLINLSTKIDAKAGRDSDDDQYAALKAKFDNGVMLLRSIDPTNAMLPSFEAKQKEWADKKKKEILIWIAMFAALVIGCLIMSYFGIGK